MVPGRDRDAALREQILDVTKAQCEPEIEPNRLMYGLGREPISGVAEFPHNFGCSAYLHPTSCRRRDKARRHVPHGLIAVIVIAAVWNSSLKILFRLVLSGSLDPSGYSVFQDVFGMILTVIIARFRSTIGRSLARVRRREVGQYANCAGSDRLAEFAKTLSQEFAWGASRLAEDIWLR